MASKERKRRRKEGEGGGGGTLVRMREQIVGKERMGVQSRENGENSLQGYQMFRFFTPGVASTRLEYWCPWRKGFLKAFHEFIYKKVIQSLLVFPSMARVVSQPRHPIC